MRHTLRRAQKEGVIDLILRRFVALSLAAIIMLGVTGCMKKNKNKRELAVEYMEKKYGEKFEYSPGGGGTSISDTQFLLVTCASFPGQDIVVLIQKYLTDKDNMIFSDNYLAVKYRDETVEFITGCAESVFVGANVFINDLVYRANSPGLSANATFAEYLSDTRVHFTIMIEVKASSFTSKEQAQQATGLIGAHGTNFYLTIVVVDDDDFGKFDRAALNAQIRSGQFVECASIKHFDGEEIQIRWLEKE